jgi:hypothetical protein
VLATLTILAVTLAGLTTLSASPAQAAGQVGNDISWPQCPQPQGYGNPMPSTRTGFVVLGLTRGLPFTVNPCLTEQARWIRNGFRPFHAYTIPAYPSTAQVNRYGGTGPFDPSTFIGKLRNVGYAQGAHSINSLKGIGLRPPRVWLDVEARSRQPWPAAAGNATTTARNRAVIEGMLAAFRRAQIPTGFYSNASGWRAITDGWQRPDIPFWETVGPRGRATAAARCTAPSLGGGPVHMVQWWDTQPMDWDVTCAGHTFSAPKVTLSWPARSSARSRMGTPGVGVTITAGPSRRQVWTLTVRNACAGAFVKQVSGLTADRIVARWDGRRRDGSPAPAGLYRVVLRTGNRTPPNGPAWSTLHDIRTATGAAAGCRTPRT